jgi:peroxiredoxin
MRSSRPPVRCLCIVLCLLLFARFSAAAPQLPESPLQWINSRPLSLDALKGKAVVFYFFEEQCPKCVEKWPPMLEASQEFQGQPVVFIGVNSGNSRRTVESYVRKVKIPWPIIVDEDRSLEKQFDLPAEISLQNIYQMRVVSPEGVVRRADPNAFVTSVNDSLVGASWKIDPSTVPAELQSAWKEVELGDYQRALPLLKRPLASRDDDERTAAERLRDLVLNDLGELANRAQEHEQQQQIWSAYKLFDSISTRFRGYEGSGEAAAKVKELAKHESVKTEQSALRKLAAAKSTGSRGDQRSVKRAVGMLESLVEDFPETEAAAEAREILDRLANPPEPPAVE